MVLPKITIKKSNNDEDVIRFLDAEISAAEEIKLQWVPILEESNRFTYPDSNNILTPQMRGKALTKQIFDETAVQARQKLESGLYSYNCGQSEWFGFSSPYYQVNQNDDAQRWFAQLNETLLLELLSSNFSLEVQLAISQLVTYGTCCLYVEYDKEQDQFFFKSYPIMSYLIKCDKYGNPTTIMVQFKLSASEIVERWKLENVSAKTKEKYKKEIETGKLEEIEVWHVVGKRKHKTPVSRLRPTNNKNLPYYSVYYERKAKHAVNIGGYHEMPYIVARFQKKEEEAYGRGCSMSVMPSIKEANYIRYKIKYAVDKHLDPAIMVPEGGVLDINKFSDRAGQKNTYNSSFGNERPYYLQPAGNPPFAEKQLEAVQDTIRSGYFNEMLDSLGNRKNMTAVEVTVRTEEQLTLFSPTQGRMQTELFSPTLERCAALLLRSRNLYGQPKLPPPPMILRQIPDFKILYRSKLALSIRNIQSAGLAKTLNLFSPLMEQRPDLIENLNLDRAFRETGLNEGIPAEWFVALEQLQIERAEKEKLAKEQMMMQQMGEMAKAVPGLSKPVEPNSPMAMLAEGQQQ